MLIFPVMNEAIAIDYADNSMSIRQFRYGDNIAFNTISTK
jgi:hypothetical protein